MKKPLHLPIPPAKADRVATSAAMSSDGFALSNASIIAY
jgi:hypothetical protein